MTKNLQIILILLLVVFLGLASYWLYDNIISEMLMSKPPTISNEEMNNSIIPEKESKEPGSAMVATGTPVIPSGSLDDASEMKPSLTDSAAKTFITKEMENAVIKKRAECLENLDKNNIEQLYIYDSGVQADLLVCQAVKDNDLEKCSILKNSPDLYKYCTDNARGFIDTIFPMFRKRSCSKEIYGLNNQDNQSLCQALIFDKSDECEKISDQMVKTACQAIATGDVAKCKNLPAFNIRADDQAKHDSGRSCTNLFYLLMALKSNDPKYLNDIDERHDYAVGQIYFDDNKDCQTMMLPFLKDNCNQVGLTQPEIDMIAERYLYPDSN